MAEPNQKQSEEGAADGPKAGPKKAKAGGRSKAERKQASAGARPKAERRQASAGARPKAERKQASADARPKAERRQASGGSRSTAGRKQAKRGRKRSAAPDRAAAPSSAPGEDSLPEGRIEERLAGIEEALAAQSKRSSQLFAKIEAVIQRVSEAPDARSSEATSESESSAD